MKVKWQSFPDYIIEFESGILKALKSFDASNISFPSFEECETLLEDMRDVNIAITHIGIAIKTKDNYYVVIDEDGYFIDFLHRECCRIANNADCIKGKEVHHLNGEKYNNHPLYLELYDSQMDHAEEDAKMRQRKGRGVRIRVDQNGKHITERRRIRQKKRIYSSDEMMFIID